MNSAQVQASERVQAASTGFAAPETKCPFLLSAGQAGLLGYDGSGAPIRALRELLGPGLGRVAELFARLNHPVAGDTHSLFTRDRYDPVHLRGSRGDHPGSSGILEQPGGFDRASFSRLVAHSSDGKTMLRRDLARAIAQSNRRDAQAHWLVDTFKSAGEFALLVGTLGYTQGGRRRVSVDELRTLFELHVLPEGWQARARHASTLVWVYDTVLIGVRALLARAGGGTQATSSTFERR